jgi:hypothetical protein
VLRNLPAALGYLPWWIAARLGLCLASLSNAELDRLSRVRLRWIVVAGGGAGLFFVVANGLGAALPAGDPGLARWLLYIPVAVLCAASFPVWRYSRSILTRARLDRDTQPVALKGRALAVIPAPDGGWAVLMSTKPGRWTWLTGAPQDVGLIRRRLGQTAHQRTWLMITLTVHPRSRVIKEISGMAVDVAGATWTAPALDVNQEGVVALGRFHQVRTNEVAARDRRA